MYFYKAKDLIEKLPCEFKKDVSYDEMEEFKEKLEKLGCGLKIGN